MGILGFLRRGEEPEGAAGVAAEEPGGPERCAACGRFFGRERLRGRARLASVAVPRSPPFMQLLEWSAKWQHELSREARRDFAERLLAVKRGSLRDDCED